MVVRTFRFTKKQLRKRYVKDMIDSLLRAGISVRVVSRKPRAR